MRKVLCVLLAVCMVLCTMASCRQEQAPKTLADVKFDGFAVGFGKADITPNPDWKIGLWGENDHYSRLSTGVLEPIGVSCVAFTDTDGFTVILFGADLHNSDDKLVASIKEGVQQATGVPAQRVQFNVSHNHAGPDMMSTAFAAVQKSNERIRTRCIQAAVDAMNTRKVATMETTICRPESMVFHTHYLGIDGTYVVDNYNDYTKAIIGSTERPDNLMQLVRFRREGEKDIVMVNWQGHPRGTGTKKYDEGHYYMLNGDYSAVMRRVLLEEADTESIFIYGASGNLATFCQNHVKNITRAYDDYGRSLAQYVIQALDTMTPADTGKIYYEAKDYVLPFEGETKGRKLCAFGFGDFGYVAEPFETFQSDAVAVREASGYKITFYASVSNANRHTGYAPDDFATTYPNYHRRVSFAPWGTGSAIRDELIRMITAQFEASGQTPKEKQEGYYADHTPETDPQVYKNPKPGDMDQAIAAKNGHFNLYLALDSGAEKLFLVKNEEVVKDILSRDTMRLLIYEGMVVGVAEE